jgi:predicted phage-related endonuclease
MDTDEVPIHYAAQVMYGLGITGRRLCIVGALFGADNIVPYILERDDETISAIREKCVDFWTLNVLSDTAPDPINMEDMLTIFSRVNGRPAEVDEETAQALQDLAAVRSQIKAYEGDEESLKFKVCDGIRKAWGIVPEGEVEDNAIIRFNGIEIGSWKKQRRSSIDTKALRAAYPAIADEVTRESTTRILKVKK